MKDEFRLETDILGAVQIPQERLYGAQTTRAIKHFAIGREVMPPELITALCIIKKAAALVNLDLNNLAPVVSALIVKACDEVLAGELVAEFPLHVWQTGSGTQTNMNVNEVIANRAIQLAGGVIGSKHPVHPNDHVNMSQSSNDVFPTAMHIAAVIQIRQALLPALEKLRSALLTKEVEFKNIVKIGRTHLQDATPIMLSQEFSGYVALIDRNMQRIVAALDGLYELVIGGTAVGTGLNAHPEFARRMVKQISELTSLPFRMHPNKFSAMSAHDELVFASGTLRVTAGALMKIANDLRWLSSGPRCGIAELSMPANEPGSSIMPGKINPTQCEALMMVVTQVMGNDMAIGIAGSQGNFELNTHKPLIIYNFLQSVWLLTDAVNMFAEHCVQGLKANEARIAQYVRDSLMLVTSLTPTLGYDKAAMIAHKALTDNISLRDACVELGYLSVAEFDRIVVPANMTSNGC